MRATKNWFKSIPMVVFCGGFLIFIYNLIIFATSYFDADHGQKIKFLIHLKEIVFYEIVLCNILFFYTWNKLNKYKNTGDDVEWKIRDLNIEKKFYRIFNFIFSFAFIFLIFFIKNSLY